MENEELKQSFARDVVLMKLVGINPWWYTAAARRSATCSSAGQDQRVRGRHAGDRRRDDGRRGDGAGRLVNKEIGQPAQPARRRAVGLTGKDGDLIRARRMYIERKTPDLEVPEIIDIGHVARWRASTRRW